MAECGEALLERDEALHQSTSEVAAARCEIESLQGLLQNAGEQISTDRTQIVKLQDLVSLCARSGAARAAASYWQCSPPPGAYLPPSTQHSLRPNGQSFTRLPI